MPPERMKPAPIAPAVTTGSLARIFLPTFVASLISARSVSTASASWLRSASISRRTCSAVRLLPAIALERGLCRLRLRDRLLRHRGRALLDLGAGDQRADRGQDEEAEHDDQEREPGVEERRERRGNRREQEPEPV